MHKTYVITVSSHTLRDGRQGVQLSLAIPPYKFNMMRAMIQGSYRRRPLLKYTLRTIYLISVRRYHATLLHFLTIPPNHLLPDPKEALQTLTKTLFLAGSSALLSARFRHLPRTHSLSRYLRY